MNPVLDKDANARTDTYRLGFDYGRGYLIVQVTGWLETVEQLIEMFAAVAVEIRASGSEKVMVVDHTRGVVPTEPDMRRLMRAVAGLGFERVRLAYVDARGTAIARMEVGEILAREHGYLCRVFDSERVARIWLDYGEQK